jgi:hypothetical protein
MNPLEQLIAQQVNLSVVATLSRTTEKIAEQMAQEILKDPEFRTQMRELVKRAFDAAFVSLAAPTPPPGASTP